VICSHLCKVKSPGKAAAACKQNQDLQRLSHSIEQLNDSMHILNTLCAEEKKNRSKGVGNNAGNFNVAFRAYSPLLSIFDYLK
jgi:hypothetical protein